MIMMMMMMITTTTTTTIIIIIIILEESFDIQHKNEKEKLKKEYLRRLRLVLGTE